MPRLLKLTAERSEKIIGYLRAGAYIETAAAAAGISKQTLYNWLRRAAAEDEEDPSFAKFAAAVEEAQALAEVRDIALIGKAAETQWQAAAWRLERKSPERWSRKDRVELSGKGGGAIEHTATVRVIALPPLEDAADEDRSAVEGEPRPAVALPVVGSR